jgi:hypothetical protein
MKRRIGIFFPIDLFDRSRAGSSAFLPAQKARLTPVIPYSLAALVEVSGRPECRSQYIFYYPDWQLVSDYAKISLDLARCGDGLHTILAPIWRKRPDVWPKTVQLPPGIQGLSGHY